MVNVSQQINLLAYEKLFAEKSDSDAKKVKLFPPNKATIFKQIADYIFQI